MLEAAARQEAHAVRAVRVQPQCFQVCGALQQGSHAWLKLELILSVLEGHALQSI